MINLISGDCLEQLKTLEDNSVDSIVTDPPYGLSFMGKHWDYDVPQVEVWREALRVLKPGGHLLSFCGTRTYHRMAVNIEDAGFEIRDMVEWVYGSGFPKSLNIGKAVDKLQGNEREVISETFRGENAGKQSGIMGKTVPRTDVKSQGASEWEGWGTALKPAHEPICMARKPLAEKTVAENVLKWGTGGLNIDKSRVGTEEVEKGRGNRTAPQFSGKYNNGEIYEGHNSENGTVSGRFPANLLHDNSEEVRECFPETKSGWTDKDKQKSNSMFLGEMDYTGTHYSDNSGNASHFFKSIIYQAKASKSERGTANSHPTVKPVALMEYLIEMVTPEGGTVLDPYMGSGSTGIAAKKLNRPFIGIEREEEYLEIAQRRIEQS